MVERGFFDPQCDTASSRGLERRAERAAILVQMGEISSVRLALEGAPSPGSRATREALSDPVRRLLEDLSEEGVSTSRSVCVGPGHVLEMSPHCQTRSCRWSFMDDH